MFNEGSEVTLGGRLLHARAAVTWNKRSPIVRSDFRGMMSGSTWLGKLWTMHHIWPINAFWRAHNGFLIMYSKRHFTLSMSTLHADYFQNLDNKYHNSTMVTKCRYYKMHITWRHGGIMVENRAK